MKCFTKLCLNLKTKTFPKVLQLLSLPFEYNKIMLSILYTIFSTQIKKWFNKKQLSKNEKKHLCISNQSIWKIQLFKSTKLNKITFSEFTNEIKYRNGIPYQLQMEGINGFTKCLMRFYLILHIHTRMHIKNKYFSYLRIWR